MTLEAQYISWGENTHYRIRPNPDSAATDGSEGIVLEWKDFGENEWKGYFFITPEQALEVAEAIRLLCGKRTPDETKSAQD